MKRNIKHQAYFLPMKSVSSPTLRLWASFGLASGLLSASATAATFPTLLFTDNFYTGLAAPDDTPDLNSNIGAAGGRQGGWLVTDVNPAGFGYDVFGKTAFDAGNGWDLRSQANWPAAGPVDQYTLRYRDNQPGQWSSVSPQIGFNSFFQDNSYRIQTQIVHAHIGTGDRWAGIVFGAQPEVRFPASAANAGVIITAGGGVQVFSNGAVVGEGIAAVPGNGAFLLDLQVLNNVGSLYVNGSVIATEMNFSTITPAVISLVGFLGGGEGASPSNLQVRFDDFAVSTIPEPSTYALIGGLVVLGAALLRKRFRKV
jgi:hypothetical protein